MIGRIWLPRFLVPIATLALALTLIFGSAGAFAQSVGPDEAINAEGTANQNLALTDAQKAAIYNAILEQKVRSDATNIPVSIGAPVSPTADLAELPEQALATAAADPAAANLKYAVVEDDVVVVDPVSMRVVDIIHNARP